MKQLIHYFFILLNVLQFFLGIFLIYIVNRQESKNDGLQGQIGSASVSSFKGKTGKEEQLVIVTKYVGAAFFFVTLLTAFGYNRY